MTDRKMTIIERTTVFGCILAITISLISLFFNGEPNTTTDSKRDKIIALIQAIAIVESGGDSNAVGDGGDSVGILQISEIMIKDVNRISKKNFTLEDRLDPESSIEIFLIYQYHYNDTFNAETWARKWNGGPDGHLEKATVKYWNKVSKYYNDFLGDKDVRMD